MEAKKTVGRTLLKRVEYGKNTQAIAWVKDNRVEGLDQKQYLKKIIHYSSCLKKIGLKAGQRLAIFSNTNPSWHFFDLSAMSMGAVTVPVYPTYPPDDALHIIKHADCEFIVVENTNQLKKIVEIQEHLNDKPRTIISIESISKVLKDSFGTTYTVIDMKEFLTIPDENTLSTKDFEALVFEVAPDDIATIIYTSGTTGLPKGVVLTQSAFVSALYNLSSFFKGQFTPSDRTLTFLPLSHIFGRIDSFLHIALGIQVIFARSIDTILEDLQTVKPTLFLAVPRIFEKVYEKVNAQIGQDSILKKRIFCWANEVSQQYFEKLDADLSPSLIEMSERKLAYNIVFSKIYEKFGGQIRFVVSGGAPISVDIIRFLRNSNLAVLEVYGLTETAGALTVNPTGRQRIGTVGLPLGDVQIKIAEDGEIKAKGSAIMSGYYKNPEETKEVFDNEGWFCTGDIGHLDPMGYLQITDRKKDLIITAGGKNIAPQKIENAMKLQPLIAQFVVVGDQRKFLTGLVGIDKESLLPHLADWGLSKTSSYEEIATNPHLIDAIKMSVDAANTSLARFESIKKFRILPVELTVENGLLTPSLKIKRKKIVEKYHSLVDEMYD